MEEDPKENIKRTIWTLAFTTILLGSAVIFLMASVTHRYFGFEGEVWFQVFGIMVGIIIAHYVHKCIKDIREIDE